MSQMRGRNGCINLSIHKVLKGTVGPGTHQRPFLATRLFHAFSGPPGYDQLVLRYDEVVDIGFPKLYRPQKRAIISMRYIENWDAI